LVTARPLDQILQAIELGTKAGFRDKSKVAAWSTVSSCTGEEGLRRAVVTMASVKARSTGPKSGAPSTWHPPQHGVGAARLRLAGLQHEVGGSSTTEWWARWVAFPVPSTKRRQGWMATTPTARHGCIFPAALASSLPFFLLLPPSSAQRPTAPGGSPHGGSGKGFAAPAAKECSAPREAALVSPFFLSLFFSSSSLVHGGGGGFGWGSGRPAGDWALIGGRLGFGAPGGRRGSSAAVPAATRHASGCAARWGRQPWERRGALPLPRCRHGGTEEGEKKTGEELSGGVHL
jgi:hypothetical protein